MSNALTTKNESKLQTLKKRIEVCHRGVVEHGRKTLESARDGGEHLVSAKKLVPHGQWLAWLDDNFPASEETSATYMRIYRGWDLIAKSVETTEGLTFARAASKSAVSISWSSSVSSCRRMADFLACLQISAMSAPLYPSVPAATSAKETSAETGMSFMFKAMIASLAATSGSPT